MIFIKQNINVKCKIVFDCGLINISPNIPSPQSLPLTDLLIDNIMVSRQEGGGYGGEEGEAEGRGRGDCSSLGQLWRYLFHQTNFDKN